MKQSKPKILPLRYQPPWISYLYLLAALFLLSSCGKLDSQQSKENVSQSFEVVKEYTRGPLEFFIRVSKKEISIADRLKLQLEVKAKENYEVKLPDFGDKLEQFGIVDYESAPPKLIEDGKIVTKKTYTLEPFLSGDYLIPPMKILFWEKDRPQSSQEDHQLESEEIEIRVNSLLPEDTQNLTIKEIVPPLEVPRTNQLLFFALLLSGAVLILGLVFLLVKRRKAKDVNQPKVPPNELAISRLRALLAEDLIEQGMIKEFYNRLSHILRHYIEDQFGLRAPEQTTEEFLRELQDSTVFVGAHKEVLREFLNHSDMVKFAKYEASNEEIQRSFDSCKQLVLETDALLKSAESEQPSLHVQIDPKASGVSADAV